MKERPILMSGPMVRALLAGTKTQTRRIAKPQPRLLSGGSFVAEGRRQGALYYAGEHHLRRGFANDFCSYGQPGDRLWVRETFIHEPADYCWAASVSIPSRPAVTIYRADVPEPSDGAGWSPAIFMPRHLSRITLEVTRVRVERVQEISEADAWAEGLTPHGKGSAMGCQIDGKGLISATAVQAYRRLWESINGAGSWDANPWVWVIEFRKA